ncbi:deoxyribodipyrimidine photo-lyase, partial [Klebsiella aerogenes]
AALAERGIPLLVEEADNFAASIELLTRICKQHQVSHLFYNYQYEFNERQRDAGVEKILKEVTCQGVDDSVLLPPGSVMTGNRFCQQPAADYDQQRDFPAIEGTSRLSPCLAVGVLSPRQCLHRLLREQPGALDGEAGASWLNEIIWREFYRHLMVYYPKLCKGRPFVAWT